MDEKKYTQSLIYLLKNSKFRNSKKHRGVAVLWTAFTLLILLLFMGLAIDGGRVYFAAHQLQNAADAAALAGARIVRIDQGEARLQAQKFAGLNYCIGDAVDLELNSGNAPDGDIVIGRFYFDERGFVRLEDLPADVKPDAVKVVTKRTGSEHGAVPLYFGSLINVNTADVSRVAIAQALGGWGAGIVALDCYAPDALTVQNPATEINLIAGGIQVNSNHEDAFTPHQNVEFIPVPEIVNVHGGIDESHFPSYLLDVTRLGAPRMPDPLCPDSDCGVITGSDCIPDPVFGTPIQSETVTVEPNQTKTIGPGYYPGGIQLLSSNETLMLEPGVYILDGEGLYINGGNLIGDGVMLYITGTGSVDMQGNGIVQLNNNYEIQVDPYFNYGVTIFQDRNNSNPAVIQGTNNLDITGTLYFPGNHVKITGTGDGFGTQLISNTIEIAGQGDIQINYDGRNPYPANKAILVY